MILICSLGQWERGVSKTKRTDQDRKIIAGEVLGSLYISWQRLASHFPISASSSPSASGMMVEDPQAGEERHISLYSSAGNVVF